MARRMEMDERGEWEEIRVWHQLWTWARSVHWVWRALLGAGRTDLLGFRCWTTLTTLLDAAMAPYGVGLGGWIAASTTLEEGGGRAVGDR